VDILLLLGLFLSTRERSVVEEVQICLLLLQYEMGILIIKLRHVVGSLAQLIFGFEHEAIKILLDLVCSRFFDLDELLQ